MWLPPLPVTHGTYGDILVVVRIHESNTAYLTGATGNHQNLLKPVYYFPFMCVFYRNAEDGKNMYRILEASKR